MSKLQSKKSKLVKFFDWSEFTMVIEYIMQYVDVTVSPWMSLRRRHLDERFSSTTLRNSFQVLPMMIHIT